jgi:hypothetical protein
LGGRLLAGCAGRTGELGGLALSVEGVVAGLLGDFSTFSEGNFGALIACGALCSGRGDFDV